MCMSCQQCAGMLKLYGVILMSIHHEPTLGLSKLLASSAAQLKSMCAVNKCTQKTDSIKLQELLHYHLGQRPACCFMGGSVGNCLNYTSSFPHFTVQFACGLYWMCFVVSGMCSWRCWEHHKAQSADGIDIVNQSGSIISRVLA